MTRGELARILIGAALMVIGCASVLATTLRPWRGTPILLAFGLSVGLYGARLLALQAPVRATIGEASFPWRYFVAFVTYLINVPLTFLVVGIIGPGWKGLSRWVLPAVIVLAVASILTHLVFGPNAATRLNS